MSSRIRTQSHYLIQTPIHYGTHPCKSVRMQPEGRRRKILAHGTRRLVAPLRHETQRTGRGLRLSAVEHPHSARTRTACAGTQRLLQTHAPAPVSLLAAKTLRQVVIKGADRLREVRLFWTMVDRRERTPLYDRYTEAIERLGIHLLTTRIAYRSKFNKELLADGAGIGRSTLLAAERSFARDAGIEALAQEIRTLVIPE